MSKEMLVPDIGDFSEVDVIEVLVNVGDTISIDDELITLESDKASMDIPATAGGVVKEIKVAVGDKVAEGSLILILEDSDESSVNVAVDNAQPKVGGESAASSAAPSAGGSGYGGGGLEEILVPDIGDFDSVDVIEVLVAEGDTVQEEDSLITLESDKASMDIPAPKAGVVKQLKIAVGDKVSQGSLIMLLETKGGTKAAADSNPVPDASSSGAAKAPARVPAASNVKDSEAFRRAHASPSIRRKAREQGIDLTQVTGTGRQGRITEDDLKSFSANGGQPAAATASSSSNAAPAKAAGGEMGIPLITQPDWSKFGEIETVPMSRIGKLSAKHLHKAWLNVPQVTHFDEADITELEAYRGTIKGKAKEMGFNFTPLVFMLKAVASGLKEFPKFNSAMDDAGENLIMRKFYNIGVAVDTPDGLVVPVIKDVDRKGMFELARELGEISVKARDGKLKAADMSGGCFSISSLGGIGGTNFTPIVNAPEVAILGITRSQERLVRKDGEIVDRLIQPLAVSYDHRVIDGAYAARFASHLSFVLSDVRNLML
ncbi:dihydrolipoyllysine-residue acetyltransferase [Cocleimonas sp. KMM 6892]|uniref:dihydrolipoyllysine-residue acetyltransferase n=1 Tax=unclassified Cocleimonas TaxID=2639732 RepID=UPI002DBA1A26|nr:MULTISPECIES: dihydrolipoyllysine-residue acetyltransferase [unclassified Cocleimonas]MEB8433117.1 dihydrolipoyllysine-residue acetyltransferase [Cocleimonas sp. KMM 6892]MEC4715902.1 dihydrolipoyllysine-residue acetyltransferase [Cocleimonas sp. KMM 6895]MEC4745363.1 dihydrolipoyllysine-residue acetyltransferase [Cocleimonas sp. KMM 6896]